MHNPDEGKSESYIRRRNWLLEQMKKTRWEDPDEKPYCRRGRKPAPKPQASIDMNKPRNKHYSWVK